MRNFGPHLIRETLLSIRQARVTLNSCLFFTMVMVFFPLTMPPNAELLRTILPGLVWLALLLAMLFSAERLFQQDYEDGVIEQWLVASESLSLLVTTKILINWFFNLLPLLIFCPLLAVLFALNCYETLVLMVSLICGSPAIFFLCALAAAFSTGLKQKGVLMALILLPLTIPILILGSGTMIAAMQGLAVQGYLALLGAMTLISVGLLPFAIAGIIRISASE